MEIIRFTKTPIEDMANDDLLLVAVVYSREIEVALTFIKLDEIRDFYGNFNYTHYEYSLLSEIVAKADLARVYPHYREVFKWK